MNPTPSADAGRVESPLSRLVLHGEGGARAEFCRYGGQLLSWVPAVDGAHDERLYLSPGAYGVHPQGLPMPEGGAIRGGAPVIFPQFSDRGTLAKHGFVRQRPWMLADYRPNDGFARLVLCDDAATQALWPHAFQLELELCLAAASISLRLHAINSGRAPFSFTAALHTYLAVEDIANVRLEGLQGVHYEDCAAGQRRAAQETQAAVHFVGEVDRVYRPSTAPRLLDLYEPRRRLSIEQSGFADTVVWNPGVEVCKRFADLPAAGYRHFLCIEAAQVGEPVQLAPGEKWAGCQILRALA